MLKRITADLINYLPAKLLPALTAFITVPIFTHLFTPEQYGNYMLAFGVSEFLLAATTTGLASSAVRFYASYHMQKNLPHYFTSLLANLAVVTVLPVLVGAVVLLLARPLIAPDIYPLVWLALLVFAANAWYLILSNILRAQERSRLYTVFELFQKYGTVIFSVLLILAFSMGVEGMMWGQFFALGLPLIPLLWITVHGAGAGVRDSLRDNGFDRRDARNMWSYALPLTIGNIAFWALRLADRYIIEAYRGTYEVGLYSVSYNISARSIDMLVGLFLLVPGPIIMRMWEERGRKATEESLTAVTRVFLLLVVPAVVGLGVLAGPLVKLLAEDAYYEGYQAIWLVATASAAFGFSQLASMGLLISKRTSVLARNQFIATGISLALNVILIQQFGFMGAAVSACLSFVIMAVLQGLSSAQSLTWHWPKRTLLCVIVASAAMAVAVLTLLRVLGPAETTLALVVDVVLGMGVGAAVYGLVLWLTGELSPDLILKTLRSRGTSSSEAEAKAAKLEAEVEAEIEASIS